MESVIKPKRPKGKGWEYRGPASPETTMGYEGHYWYHPEQSLLVISALEVATDADGHSNGPEYHLSVSKWPRQRCTSQQAKWVVRAFDLDGAEEDNHVPGGFARNFWRPVAENLIGKECECKESEPAIVEDKGDFVWRGFGK